KKMKICRLFLFLLVGYVSLASTAQGSSLTVNLGTVTGASGILVNGTLYDVKFVEGTCASVYGLCADSAFPFNKIDAGIAINSLTNLFIASPYHNSAGAV